MEITVYPRQFAVAPGQVQTEKGPVDVMVVTILDVGGTVIRVTFGAGDWAGFQGYVADHEAASAAASARARIVAPGGLAPSLRGRKH